MSSAPPPVRDQSMSLLNELIRNPLDATYYDRAAANRQLNRPGNTGLSGPLVLLTCLVIGLLLIAAAQTLRIPQEQASSQRRELIEQIESAQAAAAVAEGSNSALREQISAAQSTVIDQPGREDFAARLQRAELAAGTTEVSGPGLVLTLDDSDGAGNRGPDPRAAEGEANTLTSSDLQIVVNGLWQAGADAISINGQRLTSRSAIRFAGAAILVDYRPLARPYVVSAIGNRSQLREQFERNPGGAYLRELERSWELRARLVTQEKLVLPASSGDVLYHARVATGTDDEQSGSPSSTAREGGS